MVGTGSGYEYLIIGVAIAIVCGLAIHIGRMKQRKQAAISASRMDIYISRERQWRTQNRTTPARRSNGPAVSPRNLPEGLNEVGEAPPAYAPASKPPSFTNVEGVIGGAADDAEVQRMERGLPKYDESVAADGQSSNLPAPPPAVMPSDRSLRRLVDG
ncbi:hypothetical protein BP6252_03177 [Coleophoma cylindrospora]|uniref:Uncharacterized protein n=1 Tax=Coleophoma cylindrospora TaxID=1849047 RepID=A0A3D8S6Z0_9HELO|nr:hypothetical protein BP6252_03177 [Coleophoma cylindrospora]